jgi:hypothetical protein
MRLVPSRYSISGILPCRNSTSGSPNSPLAKSAVRDHANDTGMTMCDGLRIQLGLHFAVDLTWFKCGKKLAFFVLIKCGEHDQLGYFCHFLFSKCSRYE